MSSDASLSGWGAYCDGVSSHGFWNDKEKQYSINNLELLAVFYALESFANHLSHCKILIRVDNTSVISYINRAGGVQFPYLSELSRKIWQWCEGNLLYVFASCIKSRENVEADAASRITNIDTEWEINNRASIKIKKEFEPFSIDMFATKKNRKCDRFCSRFPQPDAVAVDAFTVDWGKEHLYGFPPFSLVFKTLQKIIIHKAEGLIVVPKWTTQPWYSLFESLLIAPPLIFHPSKNLLISPYRNQTHPPAHKLTLMAEKLSGRRTRETRCRWRIDWHNDVRPSWF